MQESGILFKQPFPYTSTQNGRAERKHHHIVKLRLTLLAQAKMPLFYWWDAFTMVVHVINELPTDVLDKKSPHYVLFNVEPNYKLKNIWVCPYPRLKAYN